MKNLSLLVIIIASVATILSFLIPATGSFRSPLILHMLWAMSIFVAVMYFSASLLSISSHKNTLGSKLNLVSLGFAILAIGQLQNPVNDIFNLWSSNWVTLGGYSLPFLVADLLIIYGLLQAGVALGIKFNKSILITTILGILGVIILIMIPHTPQFGKVKLGGILEIPVFFEGVLLVLVALMVLISLEIKNKLKSSADQASIFGTLMLASVLSLIGNVEILGFELTSYQNFLFNTGLYNIPYLLAGVFYTYYALKLNEYYLKNSQVSRITP